jgi:hypothetical protein
VKINIDRLDNYRSVNQDLDVTGTIMITEKAMIATMIMDMVEEIAMEGSDNDQQKEPSR